MTNKKIEISNGNDSLRAIFLNNHTLALKDLSANASVPEDSVASELLELLSKELTEQTFIMTDSRQRNEKWNHWLTSAAYVIKKKKLFVEKLLDELALPTAKQFTLQSLSEIGTSKFIEYLTLAARGDPFAQTNNSPEEEFAELTTHAGRAFDPKNWFIVKDENAVIGVLLPQLYEDKATEGSLFYVGVLPTQRRRGYGRSLHALGLSLLKKRGVLRYVGSTDSTNSAMKRIFALNGCRKVMDRLFWQRKS